MRAKSSPPCFQLNMLDCWSWYQLPPNLAIWLLPCPLFVRLFPLWGSALWSSLPPLKPFHCSSSKKTQDDPDQPWARCDAKGKSSPRSLTKMWESYTFTGGRWRWWYTRSSAAHLPRLPSAKQHFPSSEWSWPALGVGGGNQVASSVDDQPPARQPLLLPIQALFPTLIPFLWGEELATAIEFHGYRLGSFQTMTWVEQ